jgi:hypothetical protein
MIKDVISAAVAAIRLTTKWGDGPVVKRKEQVGLHCMYTLP